MQSKLKVNEFKNPIALMFLQGRIANQNNGEDNDEIINEMINPDISWYKMEEMIYCIEHYSKYL
jgi:hypothetical protein